MNIPKTAGDYSAQAVELAQTFYLQATGVNLVATRAGCVVDEVTETTLRGGAHFEFDSDN